MNTAFLLAIALLLDAALGEPEWLWRRLPHPAVLMGRVIQWSDKKLNTGVLRRLKGTLVILLICFLAGGLGQILSFLGPIVEIIIVAILLAQRSLVQHVQVVADGLRMSLAEGQRAVAMIVSRDTKDMTTSAVSRSAIESAAENLSDGIIAPAFWFLIGGLPGILIYKIVNTADSMIGYRTPKHLEFGWAAARLDDLLNWIPARLTALLIAAPGSVLSAWPAVKADAALHRSPNAGWPEAAMARALNIALAGPRAYDGRLQDFAWVNGRGQREIGPVNIDNSITLLWQAWVTLLICVIGIGLLTI